MHSRLLARLDAAIGRARDPVLTACLRAERAGYLGRQGQVELARSLLQQIQRHFSHQPHVAVSGWIALAEGQIDHFTRLGGTAHDRFNRAHALAAAAGLVQLQALSAAWLAHSEDTRQQRERMAAMCAEALSLAEPEHHGARWRASLTVACAYHFAGRADLAQPWYASARSHAMADGDQVALSALMVNQASLRSNEARLRAAFDMPDDGETAGAMLGTQSAEQFDAVIGFQSLDWVVPMLRSHLLVLEGRFVEALAVFDEHWPRSDPHWQARMQSCVLADRAWCLWQLGRHDEARADVQQAVDGLRAPIDVDDRAMAQARLAQLFEAFGEPDTAAGHMQAARRDHELHRQDQARMIRVLDATLGEFTPK